MKPMVVSRSILRFLAIALNFLVVVLGPAQAADAGDVSMPLMFDLRERLPKPDMAPLPRLRFVTTVDFPPFNFIDQSGKLSGFHVDLAREICRELGVMDRCQIEAVPYKDLTARLDSKDGEVIAAGMKVSDDLRRRFGVSRALLQMPARFLVLRSQTATISSPDKIGDGQLGVVKDTVHEAMVTAFFPRLKVRTFADRAGMLDALKAGEIKAVFGDALQLSFWQESPAAADCCAMLGGPYYSRDFLGEGLTLLSRKDEPLVTRAIDAALLALARSGRLNEIYLRYFPNGL